MHSTCNIKRYHEMITLLATTETNPHTVHSQLTLSLSGLLVLRPRTIHYPGSLVPRQLLKLFQSYFTKRTRGFSSFSEPHTDEMYVH